MMLEEVRLHYRFWMTGENSQSTNEEVSLNFEGQRKFNNTWVWVERTNEAYSSGKRIFYFPLGKLKLIGMKQQ